MKLDIELAEIVGIMLGDGSLHKNNKYSYQTIITSDKREINWLKYVQLLFENYFQSKFYILELKEGLHLKNYSVTVGNELIHAGIMAGNKVKNKILIPSWVLENKKLLTKTIQGLFDTDGCIYNKYGPYAQIEFKFGCVETTESVHQAVVMLGFNPTKIQKQYNKLTRRFLWRFYLSRQFEIDRFFSEIEPKNQKHLLRYIKIRGGAAGTFRDP